MQRLGLLYIALFVSYLGGLCECCAQLHLKHGFYFDHAALMSGRSLDHGCYDFDFKPNKKEPDMVRMSFCDADFRVQVWKKLQFIVDTNGIFLHLRRFDLGDTWIWFDEVHVLNTFRTVPKPKNEGTRDNNVGVGAFFGGIIGGLITLGATEGVSMPFVYDLHNGSIHLLGKEYLRSRLILFPDLSRRFEAEVDKVNHEVLFRYVKELNALLEKG